jgi:protein-tyrosine phosphatase
MANRKASAGEPLRVCFVCMGNICRSPMAEAVMYDLIRNEGLAASIEVDSAGTSGWHIGKSPDTRATEAAEKQGVYMAHRGRQFTRGDFDKFDLIAVMDIENRSELFRLAPNGDESAKVRLLRTFDPDAQSAIEIADPYYGTASDFDRALDEITTSCKGLLAHLRVEYLQEHG